MSENTDPPNKYTRPTAVTDQERELAQNAFSEFQKGSYVSCLLHLSKLETLRPKDLKLMHNKVIVEYYKSDLRKTEFIKKSLAAICGQMSMGFNEVMDDIEKCVMRYNQAVLLYHTKQYTSSLQIMNRLFSFIEPMGI